MRASNSNILIISEMQNGIGYENLLRRNNFQNIHFCKDGISALQKMEHEPALVVIAEAKMPDMDGFELASSLRDIERTEERYSYIVMVSDDHHSNVEYAWQANVDAVVPKDDVAFRLVPQVMSGERVAIQSNQLLNENSLLRSRCGYLEAGQLLDPLTGLGNRRQAMKGMDDTIRQIEARGGAVAVLMIRILDLDETISTQGQEIADEIIVGVGHKIRRLVRPLDIVTYFDKGTFAVVMQHNNLTDCTPGSYARINEGLALKSYQTRAGYLQPKINIGVCGAGAETGPPKTSCLVATAMGNLGDQSSNGEIKVSVLNHL